MDLGPPELLIVLAIALLLFGGAKLPSLARSLGQAKQEFQKGLASGAADESRTKTARTNEDGRAVPE